MYLQRFVSIQPRTNLSKFAKKSPKARKKVRTIIACDREVACDEQDPEQKRNRVQDYQDVQAVRAAKAKQNYRQPTADDPNRCAVEVRLQGHGH